MSKSGLTLHRISRHGYQPTQAHTSQRDECEETALHLLSCPALHHLRVQFAILEVPLMKLCFSKQPTQFLIAVERNYAFAIVFTTNKPHVSFLLPRKLELVTPSIMEALMNRTKKTSVADQTKNKIH
ncbi:Tbingi protein [Trypanosoma theileri]|uniref:Tbingi protein n=1 Tax=Trypanosoma theileri TaxID=67003 RepID=A0A1X0NSV9_9TRYP|nr:Tbingi protein [Trypanosoma theileri]ORC87782.1 Tbingi protein [Trypanosoma theileri]